MIGAARVLRRVCQIYMAHLLLLLVLMAEIAHVAAVSYKASFYIREMEVADFFKEPAPVMIQALLLRFRPLNMNVLPLYILLSAFPPLLLLLARMHRDFPLALTRLIDPINKTDFDVLRFAHLLALSIVTLRFVTSDWEGLRSRWHRPRFAGSIRFRPSRSGSPSLSRATRF